MSDDKQMTQYEVTELMVRQRANEVKQLLPGTFADETQRKEAVARFCRQVMTACEKNPDLLKANRDSLWLAACNVAALGLDPSGLSGEACLVPFKDNVTPMVMARGYVVLAIRSGAARAIDHNVVCEKDQFDYEFGSNPFLRHKPALGDRGDVVAAWAIATLPSGEKVYEIMGKQEIDAIRKRSRTSGSGPWVSDYNEMARKTVVRRIAKRIPWNADKLVENMIEAQSKEDAAIGVETLPRAEIAPALTHQPVKAAPSVTQRIKDRVAPKDTPQPTAPTTDQPFPE